MMWIERSGRRMLILLAIILAIVLIGEMLHLF
jgi:hypothetical protein